MVVFQLTITRPEVKYNPEVIYVFGDNDRREGYGGQAFAMRGEPNALGIRTKKWPGAYENAYYTDKELIENVLKINDDIARLKSFIDIGRTIVMPMMGVGTGRAALAARAPETFGILKLSLSSIMPTDFQAQQIMEWK